MRTKARERQIGDLLPGRGVSAHGRPELGRAGPRIGGDLLVRWAYGAMVKEPEPRRGARSRLRGKMAGALLLLRRPLLEEALDQPILQGVESDDYETPAGSECALGRREA